MTAPIPDISRPADGGSAYGRRLFLSTELAGRREIRYAQAAVLVSMLFFVVAAPFATTPLAQVPAFLPIYQSALVVCYLITAVLLYSYFSLLRSRALLLLASGYLFTALIASAHALTSPGMFSASGLLGAGPQSAAWLSMFWHGGFPLAVIAYALIKVEPHAATGTDGLPRIQAPSAILCGVALVLIVVGGLVLLATAGKDLLPAVTQANQYSPAMPAIASGTWLPGLLALAVLGWRRPHTVIDLWLMVMMCAWLFDIALAVVLNGGRYDLGWYAGRIYGLLASSFLLIVLLIENGRNYSRLIRMTAKLSNANQALERLSMRDALTELANRRAFDAYLAEQIAVARRHQRPLALVLCDVDAFKAYNDHYGHQAGDACLQQLAAALRSCCRRPADMAARYGGEEFAMILPDTDPIGAARIAEAARDAVLQLRLPHARSPAAPFVSISGGVAVLLRRIDISPHQLITVADQTLYKAKHQGRNRMVFARIES